MLRDIGQQRGRPWAKFAQHIGVQIGLVDTNRNTDGATHPRRLFRNLLGTSRGCAFFHQSACNIRESWHVRGLIQVSSAHHKTQCDLRQISVGHQRDFHSVRQRVRFMCRNSEGFWRTAGRRRLLLLPENRSCEKRDGCGKCCHHFHVQASSHFRSPNSLPASQALRQVWFPVQVPCDFPAANIPVLFSE